MLSVVLYGGLYNNELMVVFFISICAISVDLSWFLWDFQKSVALFKTPVPPPIKLTATTNINIVESAKFNHWDGSTAIHALTQYICNADSGTSHTLCYLEEVTTNMQIKKYIMINCCFTSGEQYILMTITDNKLCMSKGDTVIGQWMEVCHRKKR